MEIEEFENKTILLKMKTKELIFSDLYRYTGSQSNNVAIGANAVVIHEVPDNAVVAGVPARIISYD